MIKIDKLFFGGLFKRGKGILLPRYKRLGISIFLGFFVLFLLFLFLTLTGRFFPVIFTWRAHIVSCPLLLVHRRLSVNFFCSLALQRERFADCKPGTCWIIHLFLFTYKRNSYYIFKLIIVGYIENYSYFNKVDIHTYIYILNISDLFILYIKK